MISIVEGSPAMLMTLALSYVVGWIKSSDKK